MALLKRLGVVSASSAALLALLALAGPARAAPVRVKELVDVGGVRENALYGYGLVVGLTGTGDTETVFFTSQSISGMLGRLGIRIDPRDVRVRNVAAVMVTARLPAFARPGTQLDVTVSSIGNARSLGGGVLLITPLTGADGQVYALAQGSVQAGGFDVGASGSRFQKNQPTSGAVPGGGTIERAVAPLLDKGPLTLGLRRPDFTTASRISDAINQALGEEAARPVDPAAIEVKIPAAFKDKTVALLAKIEALEVDPDQRARIVVSERTGTIVAGQGVRIRPVAVAHGGLSISVSQTPYAFQPNAMAGGKTVAGKVAQIDPRETSKPAVALPATTSVDDLVKALNLLGASPRDLIAILQAMKAAGALDAELEGDVMKSSGLEGAAPATPGEKAAQALEATLLRQLLATSGAFRGNDTPGSKIHADMFVEVLADAVAKTGGLGIAAMIGRSLPQDDEAPALAPRAPTTPAAAPAAPDAALAGLRTTGRFGERTDPIDGTTKFHTGIDLAAPEGAPVSAAAAGVVRRAGPRGGYGNAVEIDHGHGVTTLYGHASTLSVEVGQAVKAGQTIAAVGQTGRATGPHLHFEVRVGGVPRDPTKALNAYGIRVESPIEANRTGSSKP